MPTYDNPRTGVVHWIVNEGTCYQAPCHFIGSMFFPSWDWKNFDTVGEPADVTCCKCRETAAYLDALAAAGEEGEQT